MKCKNIKAMFSEYIDGELNAEKLDIFEKHLSSCPSCKEEFSRYRNTMKSLKKWKDIEPSPQYSRLLLIIHRH